MLEIGRAALGTKGKAVAMLQIDVLLRCSGNAREVSERIHEVVRLFDASPSPWPSEEGWKSVLPGWLLASFVPAKTEKEAEAWYARWIELSPDERARESANQKWSLDGWLYWLKPENRQWWVNSHEILDPNHLKIVLNIQGWPAPLLAFDWLASAAGASTIERD